VALNTATVNKAEHDTTTSTKDSIPSLTILSTIGISINVSFGLVWTIETGGCPICHEYEGTTNEIQ